MTATLAPVLRRLLESGAAGRAAAVLVTIADAQGSTPRERGARMLVTDAAIHGTVGGGRLELEAIEAARGLLRDGPAEAVRDVSLGPALGQCCGGRVTLLFEPMSPASLGWLEDLEGGAGGAMLTRLAVPVQRRRIVQAVEAPTAALSQAVERGAVATITAEDGIRWLVEPLREPAPLVVLFGAGHVGRAVAAALAPLPVRLRWVDDRPGEFPAVGERPANAEIVATAHVAEQVRVAPPGAAFLVMTHSHPLDYELCEAILRRGDFAYAGLIGSATKRRRFERIFLAKGGTPEALRRLTCPIGIGHLKDKRPAVIAALVAAELLLALLPARTDADRAVAAL
ncbi:MAG TPA: xanthine dehydrogenase accessory protein XdhC [Stellaceae bacterium]|jgi:xanthine dehydrogenase accessory protein XdhC